jgi:hypothetical protein
MPLIHPPPPFSTSPIWLDIQDECSNKRKHTNTPQLNIKNLIVNMCTWVSSLSDKQEEKKMADERGLLLF